MEGVDIVPRFSELVGGEGARAVPSGRTQLIDSEDDPDDLQPLEAKRHPHNTPNPNPNPNSNLDPYLDPTRNP